MMEKMTPQEIREIATKFSQAVARSEKERRTVYKETTMFFCLVHGMKSDETGDEG